mmetsp:Transcript_56615/g.184133  ORF Transcript_56615/g.184133 Transcript_56615/m.184133 type:complete len:342 (-) Transcript_56615:394-1419(-)
MLGEGLVLREAEDLLGELPEPRLACAGLVPHHIPGRDRILQRGLGVLGVPPHVRDVGTLGHLDPTAAEPDADGLVDVFASPRDHVLVVALGLLPPLPAHRQKASAHQRGVAAGIGEPCEVRVPEHVADLAIGPVLDLLPRVRVQGSDRRHDDGAVVSGALHLQEEGVFPPTARADVAIKENDDITHCCVAAGLLGADQALRLLMPDDAHRRDTGATREDPLGHHRLQRRTAAVVHHDDLLDGLVPGIVPDGVHGLFRKLALESARQNDAHGLQIGGSLFRHRLRPPSQGGDLFGGGPAGLLMPPSWGHLWLRPLRNTRCVDGRRIAQPGRLVPNCRSLLER